MSIAIAVAALIFLIVAAYRGFSVILFAPIAAMLAVLATDPSSVPIVFTGLFAEKMATFFKLYFPVFLLGALFGKLIEVSGFAQSIVAAILRLVGERRAILSIMLVCAVLTYGGVSVFVCVFAAYPFAAHMFRTAGMPKRLIPATIVLGAGTFTMDSFPGSPQIQNIIPTPFFGTTTWAAPTLGLIGGTLTMIGGLAYLNWRGRRLMATGEGYGTGHRLEPEAIPDVERIHPLVALAPLLIVLGMNFALTEAIPHIYGDHVTASLPGLHEPLSAKTATVTAIWAVEGALVLGILAVLALAWRRVTAAFIAGTQAAVGGALLAAVNTASEYGFGAVIAALPGFLAIKDALRVIPDPLVNEAVTVTTLAGITGSASGGMSIALAAMADQFMAAGRAANIPPEVLHRVAAMASGGMDTLPHNGAIITLLAVTGLTHRESYRDIFAITGIKTATVFVVIGIYYATGLV